MTEVKAFGRWNTDGIKVEDAGISNYISLNARFVPKTGARYAGKRFHKSKVFIVERLINKLMIPGHKSKKHFRSSGRCTGKASKTYEIVEQTFARIEVQTKENPIKVFVKALENGAPREEIVSIEYGGARYPKAVECSPQRRIDLTLRNMTQGAYHKASNSKRDIVDTLSEEIVAAYKKSPNSQAIKKKQELERQSDSSR